MKFSARFRFTLLLAILFLAAQSLAVPSFAATPQTPDAYPQTADGLKAQLKALLASHSDPKLQQQLIEQLRIPDHNQWFLDTFGPTEGPRLDDRYSKLEPNFVESMQKRLEQFPKEPAGELEIKSYTKPVEPAFKLYKATTDDMLRDDTIYHATVGQHFLGDFIYSNGFFRWIDGQVLMELSNAPTMRVTIGGNVQAQRIISKVAPVYPKEAREIRLSGTVKLHVLIGTDGSVTQVQLINGHPALVQSAIDAVRQWRYKATTLNGKPVEVDTVVDVIYSLVP